MTALTTAHKPKATERVVKHPLSWYMPRFWHGMRFSTWARELARGRLAISPSRLPMACSITCFTMLNSALAAMERVIHGRRIDAVELAEPPLFILGHWRSGTTFLHELLIRDPAHTYATTYQCFAPHHFVLSQRWVTPWTGMFVPAKRPMDNMPAGWTRPQEDEFALENLGVPSPYLSMLFPNGGSVYPEYLSLKELSPKSRETWKRELLSFCKRLALGGGQRILLKSPTHTARVRTLLEMFPSAKFVHLSRDPYTLYASTVALWRSLNAMEGLQAIRDETWVGPYVLDSFRRMYDAYFEDRELLSNDQLVELRYEDLVEAPKTQIQNIYDQLGLGDFSRIEPALDLHLADVKNYRTNRHVLEEPKRRQIYSEWSRYFEEFGYE